jgi:hypothetical protein
MCKKRKGDRGRDAKYLPRGIGFLKMVRKDDANLAAAGNDAGIAGCAPP